MFEDPATGSLNAAIAVWLRDNELAHTHYTTRQGTMLGGEARLRLRLDDRAVWVGGAVESVIQGAVTL
jgi:predicted PhzF superfamily epimerase YddE/YHI9